MPRICLYLSAEMNMALSPILRTNKYRLPAFMRAPRRLRAAVDVRVFICLVSAKVDKTEGDTNFRALPGRTAEAAVATQSLSSVRGAGCHRLAVHGVAVVGFLAKIQV